MVMHRRAFVVGAAFVLVAAIAAACATGGGSTAPASVTRDEGLGAFETVRAVLQHPRCQNCHPPGDAPLQYDDGLPHGQLVTRGPEGKGVPGLECATCHRETNPPDSYGPNQPPGAPNWHLPPAHTKMVFLGLSSSELCRMLKDPKNTGGKDLPALLEHVRSDPLVLWGWTPGVGRAPVSIPHAEFVRAFERWLAAGAPCAGD